MPGSRRSALARVRARIDWIGVGALVLLGLFLRPVLSAGFRGDDTWNSVIRGQLALNDKGILAQTFASAEEFYDKGRPNPLGVIQGLLTVWAVDMHEVAYHLVLFVLTLAAAAVLYALVREAGLGRVGGLLVVALLAGAIQLRSYHDPLLGYAGTFQVVLILTLGSVLLLLRGLKRHDRRLVVLSFLVFLPCPLLYEGAYTTVALHAGVALLYRRGWAAARVAAPFLALGAFFIALSLYARSRAVEVASGYDVGGSHLETVRTYLIQQFTPIPASSLFFRADHASFLPLGGQPTAAELLGGLWRGAAVFLVVVGAAWFFARDRGARLPANRPLRDVAVIGTLLWLTPAAIVSAAPKYQVELVAGKGHLPALMQTFGWALVIAAAFLAMLRVAVRRSSAAVAVYAVCAAGLVGVGAGAVGYTNMRVVALETPVVETRDLLEDASARGVFDELPADSTLVFTSRDMHWPTGRLNQTEDALESLLRSEAGRRFDGRIRAPQEAFDCPAKGRLPEPDCAPIAGEAAWVRVRARSDGGTVIVAELPRAVGRRGLAARTSSLRVYAEGPASERPPQVVARLPRGGLWAPPPGVWRRVEGGDGWAIYEARLTRAPFPVASTLDDPRGLVDFTALGPPADIVRRFGTKRLLP